MAVEVVDQYCRRIYYQGCDAYDKAVGFADPVYRLFQHMFFQGFFVKDYIRLDSLMAVLTHRYAIDTVCFIHDIVNIIALSAFHAAVSQYRSMKFADVFAPRQLMESIDILSHNAQKFAFFLQLCQSDMRLIWLCVRIDQVLLLIIIKIFRMLHKERK